MALTDILQWVVIGVLVLAVIGFVVYLLYRILRVMIKAEKYLDAKAKEPGQPAAVLRAL